MNAVKSKEVKLSFIVPVYNVEKYIQKCIQSIMCQSYNFIEIILVDDGSTDKSGQIIDKIAQNDERIKVIHQQNTGVSNARNIGLEIATGDYILFIDGDDYIEEDYAEYLLGLMQVGNVDMAVSFNAFTVYSNRQVINDNVYIWDDISVIEAIYLNKINVAVWNKIYKKEIIDKYGLRFHPDIWFGEGMLFNIEYLQFIGTIAIGERKVYHQVYNPKSAMRRFKLENFICGLRSLDMQKVSWKKNSEKVEKAWEYHRRNFAKYILTGLVNAGEVKEHKKIYNKCKKGMRRNMLLPWKVDISFKSKVSLTLFSLFPYIFAIRSKYKSQKFTYCQEVILQSGSEE